MRVLIVSPRFPPTNSAELHRVRLLLPYLAENGWDAEVLAVEPEQVENPVDPWLEAGLPTGLPVHRVRAMNLHWAKIPGLGSLGFRALRALQKRGDALLSEGRFDLVYFSTTVFVSHVAGPRWKKRFGIPFAMDYQDPWVNDYFREHPTVVPPGGRLKFGVMDSLHRRMEPRILRECSGITAVSEAYPAQLARRYPWMRKPHTLVMPFPGDSSDMERAKKAAVPQTIFDPTDGRIHWIYAGVFIPAMHGNVRALFSALQSHGDPLFLARLTIHFIGTCYGDGGAARKVVSPIAAEYGLLGNVHEQPNRVPYSEVLAALNNADALLVIGSNDPGYTASKVYPYLLTEKPLLTIFHENSSVVSLMAAVGGGVCIPVNDGLTADDLVASISRSWLENDQYSKVVPLDEEAFAPYTASCQASRLSDFFRNVVETHQLMVR